MKKLWDKYGAELTIAGLLVLAYKLWPLLSSVLGLGSTLTDTVSSKVAAYVADAQQNAQLSQDKASVKALNAGATDGDVTQFRSDAEALAEAIGRNSWIGAPSEWTTDRGEALHIAKKYSRRVTTIDAKTKKVTVVGLRKEGLMLPVLYPFYKDITGHSLQADLDKIMSWHNDDVSSFYTKYVK